MIIDSDLQSEAGANGWERHLFMAVIGPLNMFRNTLRHLFRRAVGGVERS
jgi:hypothetical protein